MWSKNYERTMREPVIFYYVVQLRNLRQLFMQDQLASAAPAIFSLLQSNFALSQALFFGPLGKKKYTFPGEY